jgi:tryptophan 7-halogenase
MILKVIVLGSGTAGLIAALTLKRRSPMLDIEIIRDPDIGVIGVGEGTTVSFLPREACTQRGGLKEVLGCIRSPRWKWADEK